MRKAKRMRRIAMLTMISTASCVLPNDPFEPVPDQNRAPRFDLGLAVPEASVTQVSTNCTDVRVEVPVVDPDDDRLLVRWVIRDDDDTRWENDFVSNQDPGSFKTITNTFPLRASFPDQLEETEDGNDNEAANRTAVVILYVTDSPAYAIDNPNDDNQGQKPNSSDYPATFNLGALPPPDPLDGRSFAVSAYSWTFEFNRRGLPCTIF